MRNPWLDIPLADYEGHMASPGVAQAQTLSEILADVLDRFAPQSIAVLGCAGGNGFDRVRPDITRRVVGVDINPGYITKARERYEGRFRSLELHVADIQNETVVFEPVDLLFAALILEYVDVGTVFARIRSMVGVEGRLVTVVQLRSVSAMKVTPSPFASLQALGDVMRLVSPDEVLGAARSRGYIQVNSGTVDSADGKQFQIQVFMAST